MTLKILLFTTSITGLLCLLEFLIRWLGFPNIAIKLILINLKGLGYEKIGKKILQSFFLRKTAKSKHFLAIIPRSSI